jgi:hypothetical protein
MDEGKFRLKSISLDFCFFRVPWRSESFGQTMLRFRVSLSGTASINTISDSLVFSFGWNFAMEDFLKKL